MKLRRYLSKYGVRIAVIVVVVALIALSAASILNGRAGLLRNADGALKAPVEKATAAVLDWVEGIYGYIYEYNRILEENNTLLSENAALKEQVRDYADLEEENARLREVLGFAEKHTDMVLESAKIVSWDTSNYTSAFTISKGASDALSVGDCVVTEYGALVGQIIELGDDWATVRTLIDTETDIGVLVGEYSYAGMVTGEFSLMKQGRTRLAYLASGAQLFAGDEVLTSGRGGSFPPGLVVGTVDAVMTESGGQITYGVVAPACDLSRLSQVFIIKEFEIVE